MKAIDWHDITLVTSSYDVIRLKMERTDLLLIELLSRTLTINDLWNVKRPLHLKTVSKWNENYNDTYMMTAASLAARRCACLCFYHASMYVWLCFQSVSMNVCLCFILCICISVCVFILFLSLSICVFIMCLLWVPVFFLTMYVVCMTVSKLIL